MPDRDRETFFRENHELIGKIFRSLAWCVALVLLYYFILRRPLYHGRWTEEVNFLRSLAWPLVVVVALTSFYRPIASFLEGLSRNVTKLSAWQFTIELSSASSEPINIPSVSDIQQPVPAIWTTDSSGQLYEQIQKAEHADYAIIDLGIGNSWLTSRLYILAVMLERMRGVKYIVFVDQNVVNRRFIGMARTSDIRWSLAFMYPWLESAYDNACASFWPNPKQVNVPFHLIVSRDGALFSGYAANLVSNFIAHVQMAGSAPTIKVDEWTDLGTSRWERAAWLDENKLREILDDRLRETKAPVNPDVSTAEQAKSILRRDGEFVALVEGEKFKTLVNRDTLLEGLAVQLSQIE